MRVCGSKVFLPQHECFVDGVSQLEGVVTDGQVVLQPERLQHDAVSDRESQTQVITGVTLKGKQRWLLGRGNNNFLRNSGTLPAFWPKEPGTKSSSCTMVTGVIKYFLMVQALFCKRGFLILTLITEDTASCHFILYFWCLTDRAELFLTWILQIVKCSALESDLFAFLEAALCEIQF